MKGKQCNMPVQIVWDDPEQRSIMLFELVGKWTWEEFYHAYEAQWEEVAEIGHRVDAIVDLTQSQQMPGGAINQVRRYSNRRPQTPGITVLAGANNYISAFIEAIQKLFSTLSQRTLPMQFAKTVDEARAVIAKSRAEVGTITE
jgi:hypothetical protein